MKRTQLIALGLAMVSGPLVTAQESGSAQDAAPVTASAPVSLAREAAAVRTAQAEKYVAADRLTTARVAQADAEMAQANVAAQAESIATGIGGTIQSRSARALVIPKEATDAQSLGEVEEDLGVMAHILDKAVSGADKASRAMGIPVYFRPFGFGANSQNLYIEGYGAIFQLSVNYPLLPPPTKADEAEAKPPVNNDWEEARRELARPSKGSGGDPFFAFEERYGADAAWNPKAAAAEYDADKVESLKKDLTLALKNAANIRRLRADETVTVVVSGASAGGLSKLIKSTTAKSSSKPDREVFARATAGERGRLSDSAKLILRARKSDADAFQNGKLSFEEFSKQVSTVLF